MDSQADSQAESIRKSQNSSLMLRSKLDMEHSPTAEHEDTVRMTGNSSLTMSVSSSGSSGDHADEEILSERRGVKAGEMKSAPEQSAKADEENQRREDQDGGYELPRSLTGKTGRLSVEGELHEDDGSSYTGEAPFSTPHSMPSAFRDTHASGGWAKRPPTPFSRRASLASDHSNTSSRDGSFQQRMDDRVFRKGVIEVHSEIDKLLGSLRAELQQWRQSFDNLLEVWMSRWEREYEMEEVEICDLEDFRIMLDKYYEDTEAEKEERDGRQHAAMQENARMMRLIDHAMKEMDELRRAEARKVEEARKEYEAEAQGLKSQVGGLSYQLSQKDEEVQELQRRIKSQVDQIAEAENEKLDLQDDCKAKDNRIDELERQVSEARKAAKAKTSAAAAAELEVANLQAWRARADDEKERLSLELRAKTEELKLAVESNTLKETRLKEASAQILELKARVLELQSELEEKAQKIAGLEQALQRALEEAAALKKQKEAWAESCAKLQQDLSTRQQENERFQEEVPELNETVEGLKAELANWKETVHRLSEDADAAKRAEKELRKEVDRLREELDMTNRSFKGLETAYQELEFDSAKQHEDLLRRVSELQDAKDAAEDKARRTLRVMESQHKDLEMSLREKYENVIAEQDRSIQQLDEERKQLMKSHADKLEKMEADRKRREELDRKQLIAQLEAEFAAEKSALDLAAAESLAAAENHLRDHAHSQLSEQKARYEGELERIRSDAAKREAELRQQMAQLEADMQSRTEKLLQEQRKAIEAEILARQEQANKAKEILSQQLLDKERAARRALMEKSDAEARAREERARGQSAQERMEAELDAARKELEAAREKEASARTKAENLEKDLESGRALWEKSVKAAAARVEEMEVKHAKHLMCIAKELKDAYERSIQDLARKTATIVAAEGDEEQPASCTPTRQSWPQLFMTCASSPLQAAAMPRSPSSPGFKSVLQDVAEVVNVSPA